MKTLKKKFSIYQSSQKVRKLWVDYSETRGGESRDTGETGGSNGSGSGGGIASINLAAGQGPGRALRAFVEAVDLSDSKQAGVLQNLDDGGQGDLVATLLDLAEAVVGAGPYNGSFSPGPAEIALAEKALKMVETCLAGNITPKRPREGNEHLKQLLGMLALETSGSNLHEPSSSLLLDRCPDGKKLGDVKATVLRLLRLLATDHERVVEIGLLKGFKTVATLALPEGSPMSVQATSVIVHFLSMASDSDSSRATTPPESKGKTGRWSKVGRFGKDSRPGSTSGSRVIIGESVVRAVGGGGGEEDIEASAGSSSSSSFADAASFVYSSFQALVSSGRDHGGLSPSASIAMPGIGPRGVVPLGYPLDHPPMAVLPEALAEEAARVSALEGTRMLSVNTCSVAARSEGKETQVGNKSIGVPANELADGHVVGALGGRIVEMMLEQGVLAVLVDVIMPALGDADIEDLEGNLEIATVDPPVTTGPEIDTGAHAQLDALDAVIAISEGHSRGQTEFARLGGYARLSRLMHLVAAAGEQSAVPQQSEAGGDSTDRSRSHSVPHAGDSFPEQEDSTTMKLRILGATFDALFRLALDGRSVLPGARADGANAVKTLVILAARSPSVAVALRAARSLQALLKVRPLNAVTFERHDALGLLCIAAAVLVSPREHDKCLGVGCRDQECECGLYAAETVTVGRLGWALDDKRDVLSTLNEVIRMLAAVYSRRDVRALERYARILLCASASRFGANPEGGKGNLGMHCSSCNTSATQAVLRRCVVTDCSGRAGLCGECDASLHQQTGKHSHVRVPVSPSMTGCEWSDSCLGATLREQDPAWAVEAGKALIKAMVTMLDDRESFGLPPTPVTSTTATRCVGSNDGSTVSNVGILTIMLQIAQHELLEPLHAPRTAALHDSPRSDAEECLVFQKFNEEPMHGKHTGSPSTATTINVSGQRGGHWTDGWLLGSLEIVARLVVRGDDATVAELGAVGGWGFLAHITRLRTPPPHLSAGCETSIRPPRSVDNKADGEKNEGVSFAATAASESSGDRAERLSEAWLGWAGARRLALWILREALLTGAGRCGNIETGAVALTQPARWLVWLVRELMVTHTSCDGVRDKSYSSQARGESLLRLAVLNELRLAIGSFAPCEVVMEGCTRVLPLIALKVGKVDSRAQAPGKMDAAEAEGESSRRPGVSPNRHPEARTGAANLKVVGRLAGDQRGVVRNTLVSEGLMEALLTIVEGDASLVSSDAREAESGLALLCLADLAAGSEMAKARLGSTLGYDTLAKAAHGAGVVMHAQHFSLWLETSVRRNTRTKTRLPPPFSRLVTTTGRAVAFANVLEVSSTSERPNSAVGGLPRGRAGDAVAGDDPTNDDESSRGRPESRGSRRRSWRKRSPRSRGALAVKDGITWVPRTLPKLSRALSRGATQPEDGEGEGERADPTGGGREHEEDEQTAAKACMFDEFWLPPGLLTLAQDVLLIDRVRGGGVVRGEDRYFIAEARGTKSTAVSETGPLLWRPSGAKFRGLEAAIFPFLLLPLVPSEHQPQAAGQLSRLLDANPANAAALCHLRAPLALLKLACRLPDQSQVRDLYFRLAAQLMSHHMSPADATELFHLASLQPSAWARLGRMRVISGTDLINSGNSSLPVQARDGAVAALDGGDGMEQMHVSTTGHVDQDVALPPHSGELQMQLLYVIGTVVETPSPAWFFHMDGCVGSGLMAGPLARFPPQRVGYSLSMWVRPALFSGGAGRETALFSLNGKSESGVYRPFLRLSLRQCQRPGDGSAPPAAAGIGASEDDDQGNSTDDASAVVHVGASIDESPGHMSQAASAGGAISSAMTSGIVNDPEVRCGRWQYLVVTHTRAPDTSSSSAAGPWADGVITVYVDGEGRALSADTAGNSARTAPNSMALAYPAAVTNSAPLSASVGCWEEDKPLRDSTPAATGMGSGVGSQVAARFSGQIATVALVEGAWTAEMAKAAFLRGPGAAPPGKRILFTGPGDIPPTPFLDPLGDDERLICGERLGPSRGLSPTLGVAGGMDGGLKTGDDRPLGDNGHGSEPDPTSQDASCSGSGRGVALALEPAPVAQPTKTPSGGAGTPPVLGNRRPWTNASAIDGVPLLSFCGDPPSLAGRTKQHSGGLGGGQTRLSVMFTPLRRAIDSKYGVASSSSREEKSSMAGGSARAGTEHASMDGMETAMSALSSGTASGGSVLQDSSMSMTVASLAVAAGCVGSKDSGGDDPMAFRLAGRGTWVYATTPLHAAVQAAGGFRLCLPFLRMDHGRQVAALRVLAGLLEASAEGMDAFRVRDGFNVLYHALAQGDDALQQLSMDTFDTLFDLMTSEALQGAVDVTAASLSSVSFLDTSGAGGGGAGRPNEDTAGVRATEAYGGAGGLAGVKPIRSPEALRLVVDLLGHCERATELQARVMEALVDALDGSSTGIQVWRRAFNEAGALAPLLYLLSPPAYDGPEGSAVHGVETLTPATTGTRSGSLNRRVPSFLLTSGPTSGGGVRDADIGIGGGISKRVVMGGERPLLEAGPAARTQATRMIQVLIAGSAGVAPVVRPQDPTAAIATSTSTGCMSEHLAVLVGFVLRCHLEAEELADTVRRQNLHTGQEENMGNSSRARGSPTPGSALSLLALTRQVGGAVLDLLVQLCGGDGGAVVVGMMSQAFPGGGQFFVPLELLSSSNVETRVSAVKLLSLMLVRKGDDGRRSSTSTFFSSDENASGGGRPGPDPQALRAFEKLGGFAAMCRQLELHTPCQAICDALMGMIFGVWGSKHEPRPIREKDVMAIKGNKESWLRAWWSNYSSSPDDEQTNPPSASAAPGGLGLTITSGDGASSSFVDRLRGTTAVSTAAPTPAVLPCPLNDDAAAVSGTIVFAMEDEGCGQDEEREGEGMLLAEADAVAATTAPGGSKDAMNEAVDCCASSLGEGQIGNGLGEVTSGGSGGIVAKQGRFAALRKAVEAHSLPTPLKGEAAVQTTTIVQGVSGTVERARDKDKDKEKEDSGFLSGLFRRLSLDHAHAAGDSGPRGPIPSSETPAAGAPALAPVAKVVVESMPAAEAAVVMLERCPALPASISISKTGLRVATQDKDKDKLFAEDALVDHPLPPTEPDPFMVEECEKPTMRERNGSQASADAGEGGREGGGGSGAETLNVVLPEAVEVLMRVLQRAPNPAVLARPLLQLESAVAWLPSAPAGHTSQASGRAGSRRDMGSNRGGGGEDYSESASRSVGRTAGGGGGGSGTVSATGTVSARVIKGKVGGDRERNADAVMSRQGWLAWCFRLVDVLNTRNESGDLVPGKGMTTAYGGGQGDELSGSDRWGTGGSEASEAGGYLDDLHSETTDTGSAFSYYESSSVGRSVAQDGAVGALEAFSGPVYGLVAALLEQDMARAPRDKRGHRFLELFSLPNANAFQAAVLEDALDGIQDSPTLSSDNSHPPSPGRSSFGRGVWDGGSGDDNVRRLESLRELLSAALDRRPDLPLGLCVKSVHTINLLGYHNSHEARSRMKSVGLLGVRDDLIRRCLFHPTAGASEQVSALSQVEDALETLVSQPGKSGGDTEASAAGDIAVQLLHLFTEVTATATAAAAPSTVAPAGGPLSPIVRTNAAATSARATQVAAARALGRAAVASAACRSTVIRLARDAKLLVRFLPALRCPLTAEEMEAIELGNMPDAMPSMTSGSRWSLGSLSLLPTSSNAPTSCMSDDAENDDESLAMHSPQRTANNVDNASNSNTSNTKGPVFFPPTPSPSTAAGSVSGSWPPSASTAPGTIASAFLGGPGCSSTGGGGNAAAAATTVSGSSAATAPATATGPNTITPSTASMNGGVSIAGGGSAPGQFRLDEVLEEEGEEDEEKLMTGEIGDTRVSRWTDVEEGAEEETMIAAGGIVGSAAAAAAAAVVAGKAGSGSPARRRARRRSNSDLSAASLGSLSGGPGGGGVGAVNTVALGSSRRGGGGSYSVGGGSSWHGSSVGRSGGGGGCGVPEHDLQAFVRWYNGEERREMRDGVHRRVSKALAPLVKARGKTASKNASKRDKSVRTTQKREAEATAAKEKAASDALERCRAHAERSAERTSATVDAWLSERRRRWEAGRTRCEELAPPLGGIVARGGTVGTVAGPRHGNNNISSISSTVEDDGELHVAVAGAVKNGVTDVSGEHAVAAGVDNASKRCREGESDGEQGVRRRVSSWDWGKGGGDGGVSFEDFFETFAG